MAASGQSSVIQIDWRTGPAAGMTAVLGPQRRSNTFVRVVATTWISDMATPKVAAARPTFWIK